MRYLVRGFCRNSSLQAAWHTWIALTTGFERDKIWRNLTAMELKGGTHIRCSSWRCCKRSAEIQPRPGAWVRAAHLMYMRWVHLVHAPWWENLLLVIYDEVTYHQKGFTPVWRQTLSNKYCTWEKASRPEMVCVLHLKPFSFYVPVIRHTRCPCWFTTDNIVMLEREVDNGMPCNAMPCHCTGHAQAQHTHACNPDTLKEQNGRQRK